ncbi:MAG: YicC/YloC family endoribonuclease [bacterium]|jgi:uncharacterized protein (TIGR00255 family)
MQSMTGYGRGECRSKEQYFQVEIRSLNHRYFECSIRIVKQYSFLEERVRKYLQESINRGRVEVNITSLGEKGLTRQVKVDKELALAYYNALEELGGYLKLQSQPGLELLANFPDVLIVEEEALEPEKAWEILQTALTSAVSALVSMRAVEGKKLQEDIIHRIGRIEQVISSIKAKAPQVVEEYRSGLKKRISNLVGENEIEESRIIAEVAYFAEKVNIAEELVRMASHLELFRGTVDEPGAIGRKLEFILQEMYREINTIGAKASNAEISQAVVEVKSELEKIREQLQNVE